MPDYHKGSTAHTKVLCPIRRFVTTNTATRACAAYIASAHRLGDYDEKRHARIQAISTQTDRRASPVSTWRGYRWREHFGGKSPKAGDMIARNPKNRADKW